uniref:Mitochondrial import inner membrane translocase subunit TIM22 n=1 Tax=Aureoumbra lagunensis TaxID=44058 RepID=A0A7S3JN34_9STRA
MSPENPDDEEAPTPDPYSSSETPDPYAIDQKSTMDFLEEPVRDWPGVQQPLPSPQKKDVSDTKKNPLENLNTVQLATVIGVKCGATAVVNGINGAIVGALIGGVMALGESTQVQWPDARTRARHIGIRIGSTGAQFASFLAAYTGIRCTCTLVRRKDDVVNSGIAAAIVSGVPAMRTGNPSFVFMTAFTSAALMMAIESMSSASRSSSSSSSGGGGSFVY